MSDEAQGVEVRDDHCHWCGKARNKHGEQTHQFERCKCRDHPFDAAIGLDVRGRHEQARPAEEERMADAMSD